MPLIDWTLRSQGAECALQPAWADSGRLRVRPEGLVERLRAAVDLYPCGLLLVHRDCETRTVAERQAEINVAVTEAFAGPGIEFPIVCVVPRRMTEAWLLISEGIIRRASGNPNGTAALNMPAVAGLESLVDPKETLFALLRAASGLNGRRLRGLRVHGLVHRVAELLDDFSVLRALPAFVQFEQQIASALAQVDCSDGQSEE